MADVDVPTPTDSRLRMDSEYQRWNRIFAGDRFYYGEEPGPVARRAVEVLIQAIDRVDKDRNRTLLQEQRPDDLYNAAKNSSEATKPTITSPLVAPCLKLSTQPFKPPKSPCLPRNSW